MVYSWSRNTGWSLLMVLWMMAASGLQEARADDATGSVVRVWRLTDPELNAHQPQFNGGADSLVFSAGADGAQDIYSIGIDGSGLTRLTDHAADDRDPTWIPGQSRIVFSSNREGSYDLYAMDPDGTNLERLTELEGDELEPAVSPLQYTMVMAGYSEGTDDGGSGFAVDTYGKMAFTHRTPDSAEVWFQSIPPRHSGQVTPASMSCHSPSWSGNGLSLAWTCDMPDGPMVFDSQAEWDQSLGAALSVLMSQAQENGQELAVCDFHQTWEEVEADPCTAALPRRFTRYNGEARSEPANGLTAPAYSANQVLLLAQQAAGEAALQVRARGESGEWQALALPDLTPSQPVWSPDGRLIAFESFDETGKSSIYLAEVSFYLQDVVDLVDYPELHGEGMSPLLQANHFVARPGTEREFFRYYDQLGYLRRAPFITADAVLQAFHDEFSRLLRQAENDAAQQLLELSSGLMGIYGSMLTEQDSETLRYYARYFAVPFVLLTAAANVGPVGQSGATDALGELLGPWDAQSVMDQYRQGTFDPASLSSYLSPEEVQRVQAILARSSESYESMLAAAIPEAMTRVPETLREDVQALLNEILAHSAIGEIQVPGRTQPFYVDWTQFIARGHYANSALTGYFLAMMWFGQVPIPLDESAFGLLDAMQQQSDLWERYRRIDALVGAFMGRPVDVTLGHLLQVREEHPEWMEPFQAEAIAARLTELRGPIPFRGLQVAMAQLAAEGGPEEYPLQCTMFPRRYGLDVEFFSRLTHPDVAQKPFPTAIELFAGFGLQRAAEHALALAQGGVYLESYQGALQSLAQRSGDLTDAYFSTDIYHSWLALLRSLATPLELPDAARLDFARNPAWQDRQIFTALAGFALLKHDAILYSFQEYGIEAGGDMGALFLAEQPNLPVPVGFVDPMPQFFSALSNLAGRVYEDIAGGVEPSIEASLWSREYGVLLEEVLSAQRFSARLAQIAAAEVQGQAVGDQDNSFILLAGAMLEQMFLNVGYMDQGAFGNDEGRTQTGIALATDIYTNIERREVLELAVGRIMDLFVVVPNPSVGRRMTQGGLFSFFEFTQPMDERLTDFGWNERLESGNLPPLPPWSRSFIEAGDDAFSAGEGPVAPGEESEEGPSREGEEEPAAPEEEAAPAQP